MEFCEIRPNQATHLYVHKELGSKWAPNLYKCAPKGMFVTKKSTPIVWGEVRISTFSLMVDELTCRPIDGRQNNRVDELTC
jgi:hypothetical protein